MSKDKLGMNPLNGAEHYIKLANEKSKSTSNKEPYSAWFLDNRLTCPFCGEWLIGYQAEWKSWKCSCSHWYEEYGENNINDTIKWKRNKISKLTQPKDE
jgi:hypothetical protein